MRNKTELSKRAYDKKALQYDNTFDGKFTRKFKIVLLDTVTLKDGDTILDVACGNGTLLNAFSQKGSVSCYGIDISSKMIEVSKERYPHISFTQGDCTKTSYQDNTFDAITVSAAFHHFPEPEQFMKEAFRILKPNGTLYIAEVYMPAVFRWCVNPFIQFSKDGDVKIYSSKELISYFDNEGFRNISTSKIGHVQIIKGMK